jgi:hypothetical protein
MVVPQQLLQDPWTEIRHIASNLISAGDYAQALCFRNTYDYFWLPLGSGFYMPPWLVHVVRLPVVLFFTGVAIAALLGCIVGVLKRSRDRSWSATDGITVALIVSLAALASLESTRLFYESRLFVPATGIAALLTWRNLRDLIRRRTQRVILGLVFVIAIVSQAFGSTLAFASWSIWVRNDAGVGPLSRSIPSWSYNTFAQEIGALATECTLSVSTGLHKPVLDVWTYPVFSSSYRPFEIGALVIWEEREDIPAFMATEGSEGLITRCDSIPDRSKFPGMLERGGFCCWRPPTAM